MRPVSVTMMGFGTFADAVTVTSAVVDPTRVTDGWAVLTVMAWGYRT